MTDEQELEGVEIDGKNSDPEAAESEQPIHQDGSPTASTSDGGASTSSSSLGFGANLGTLSTATVTPRSRLRDTSEKIVYFFALIAGSGLILFGKSNGWLGAWPAAIIAVLLIVGYLVFAWGSQRENPVRADRMGDNCYYLGLVYTLASLIASLIRIENGAEVLELIGNFGIALVSTAAGIIARLVMIQMRSEADDIDQRARVSLAQTAQLMQSDLLAASTAFRSLLIDAQESFRISMLRTEENVETAREVTKKVLELDISPEELNASLVGVIKNIQAATDGIAEASAKIRTQSDAIASTAASVDRFDENLPRINKVLSEISTTLERQRLATEGALSTMETQSKAAAQHAQKLEKSAEEARNATKKVYSALGDLSSNIVDRLGK